MNSSIETPIDFAVGCLHLGVNLNSSPSTFTYKDYQANISATLNSIPNVDKLKISISKDLLNSPALTLNDQPEHITERVGCFPLPRNSDISFIIYIPRRFQAKILNQKISDVPLNESFNIWITYMYDLPIAYVYITNGKSSITAIEAFKVVSEFLRQEISSRKPQNISFQILEPTPFQAYFKLIKGENTQNTRFLSKKENGFFPKVDILYNPNVFKSRLKAFELLTFELSTELELFYYIVQNNRVRKRKWRNLKDGVENLTRISFNNAFEKIISVLNFRKLLDSTYVEAAKFSTDEVFFKKSTEVEIKSLYGSISSPLIQDLVYEQKDTIINYPVKQILTILTYLRNRQNLITTNMVVLLAAILGGILGAIGTLLVIIYQSP